MGPVSGNHKTSGPLGGTVHLTQWSEGQFSRINRLHREHWIMWLCFKFQHRDTSTLSIQTP